MSAVFSDVVLQLTAANVGATSTASIFAGFQMTSARIRCTMKRDYIVSYNIRRVFFSNTIAYIYNTNLSLNYNKITVYVA